MLLVRRGDGGGGDGGGEGGGGGSGGLLAIASGEGLVEAEGKGEVGSGTVGRRA